MAKKIKFPGSHPIQISNDDVTVNIPGGTPIEISTPGGPAGSGILLETGDYLLLETGDYFLMEA